jgi:formylglycine-generating enzyme required for sulfatase activity
VKDIVNYQGAGKLFGQGGFILHEANKIRSQYSEDGTNPARGWHSHSPEFKGKKHLGYVASVAFFSEQPQEDQQRPLAYEQKPMVSVSWQEAEGLCSRLSTSAIRFRLPTEAEGEKAARGGLIGCSYPWGNEPASDSRCDFN